MFKLRLHELEALKKALNIIYVVVVIFSHMAGVNGK